MKIPIYQVDAFTSEVFSGNPAAVCLLDEWIDDKRLQSIAAENNLSETAYLVQNENGFDLRWFTPKIEVALCGHAILASAFVQFVCRQWREDISTLCVDSLLVNGPEQERTPCVAGLQARWRVVLRTCRGPR
jgi:PhzF family phenazine biosynthesis protein